MPPRHQCHGAGPAGRPAADEDDMLKRPDHPIVIVGGGCAGLHLAAALARLDRLPRPVLVLEPRTAYEDDRRWCFFRPRDGRFDRIASAAWPATKVATPAGEQALARHADRPYQMVRAIDFYCEAQDAILKAPFVTLRTGVTVAAVHEETDRCRVETDGGAIEAEAVVDTRPPPGGFRADPMVQLFAGVEVEAEAPVFDVEAATLMDFAPADRGDVRFTYVLPLSPRRALVEATRFAVAGRPRQVLEADLATALARTLGAVPYAVVQREAGAIPMAPGLRRKARPTGEGRVVRAGLAGGAARPSTGYAFLAIARWAELSAARVAAGLLPPPVPPQPLLDGVMDRIFLDTLSACPDRAPGFFHAMFDKVAAHRLLRFLSGEAGIADRLAVAASLPPAPFLATLAGRRGASRRAPEAIAPPLGGRKAR